MEAATRIRRAGALTSFFAGLQAGMLGILAMLAWLGVSAAWQQRSFWTSENLMASLFYGNQALRPGFAGRTLSGLAVYLILYSLLGALLAFALRDRVVRIRVLLLSVLFALAWYYFSYRVLWKTVAPLVALLHVEHANILGHLVYGTFLARYPVYLPGPEVRRQEPEVRSQEPEGRSQEPEAGSQEPEVNAGPETLPPASS